MIPTTLAGDVLGIASGVVAAIGTGCYVRGWQRGHALPSQVSWTWWTLVSAAVTGALALHHAPWSLLVMPAESAAGCGLILILSLVRGADRWDAAARFMTVGVIAVVPVWLIYPNATAAVALSAAVEVAGDVPTVGGAWRNPRAEPASSWACVAVSGVLSLGAATLTSGQAAGYMLPAAWVLGGVSIPAAAMLGSWARRVPGRRESIAAACFLALAPVPLAAMTLAGLEVITGIRVPGIPVVASSGVANPPSLTVLPAQTRRERRPAHIRRPVLVALPPSTPSRAARPSPSRTRKPSPRRSSPRPSPTRTPDPAPTSTSPYPSPTTATPSPVPTGSPSPSATGTPSPTPSPTQTYPSPTATATPSPTYTG